MPTTSWPRSSSSWTRYPQMNPAAPVTRTFTSEPDPLAQRAPDVDHVLAADLEPTVRLVRGAEDEDLALAKDAFERREARVVNVGVGADDTGARPRQELAELVAERRPRVVRLGFERHPEDPDRLAPERTVPALECAHDVRGEPFVDLHRGLAHREMVRGERGELHRVLEQAWPGREPGAGEVGCARVVLADRPEHVGVVDAGLVGDHEELVRDRELHVAPGVREQLRELGLLRRGPNRLRSELPEEGLGAVRRDLAVCPDDLGQRVELLERVPFRDPLRAE